MTTTSETGLAIPELLARVHIVRESLDKAKKLYGDRFAPDFSPFDFMRDDEVGLSKILAWLLDRDPKKGSHAQGALFLKLFCFRYGIDWSNGDLESSSIRTEISISNGRLDIFVQSSADNKCIIIENKPRARDSADQIKRYLAWAQGREAPYRLIYLSGDGSDPDKGSISAEELECAKNDGTFQKVSYSDLRPWLADCHKECRADRVTAFIRDFERYIEKEFKRGLDMTETREITMLITGSPDLLQSAFSIFAAEKDIKIFLLKKLRNDLDAALKDEFAEVDVRCDESGRIDIFFDSQSRYSFSLEWETNFKRLWWGLRRRNEKIDTTKDAQRYAELFPDGKPHLWWAWWRYASPNDKFLQLTRDWQYESQPWEEIGKRDVMAKNIAHVAKDFKGKINDPSLL